MWLRCAVGALPMWVLVGCTPAQSLPEERPCRLVGSGLELAALQQAFAESSGTLVLTGRELFECGCGAPREPTEERDVKSAAAERDVKGASAERDVKGAAADRDVKGDAADRDVKGAWAERDVKGASAHRDVKGDSADDVKADSADRDVKGAAATVELACAWVPECGGFSVSGGSVSHTFDGQQFIAVNPSCVRPTR